ncbi:MAG TPA: hypothetical protein VNT52_03610, partial [Acidimicrobiales bacterium]|nr:hypothetical protein [Acidimicrobiales bacterium]
ALAQPIEVGTPPEWPDVPPSHGRWTHRYRRSKTRVDYELYDQIWVSPDLAGAIAGAWIYRRSVAQGDASDHDPAVVELEL